MRHSTWTLATLVGFGTAALGCAASPPRRAPAGSPAQVSVAPPPPTSSRDSDELWAEVLELERGGRYEAMIRVLTRGTEQAPNDARFWSGLGVAHVKLAAERDDVTEYARAQAPLERCLALEPANARCHHLLGVVLEWAGAPGPAFEHYFAALEHDPQGASYYAPPAALAVAYRLYDTADGLLDRAVTVLVPSPTTADDLARVYTLKFEVAQGRDDAEGMVTALRRAVQVGGAQHPELEYALGAAYATLEPPRIAAARAALEGFARRACHPVPLAAARENCRSTEHLLDVLRWTSQSGGNESAAASEPPLPAPPARATLPPLPRVPAHPTRHGEHYTVWGASLALRSVTGRRAVTGGPIAIEGYIAASNLRDAPRCAVHRPGIADPEGCRAPVPTFWLCDAPQAPRKDCIAVMGWAANFAQLYGAVAAFEQDPSTPYVDDFWGIPIPQPLPTAGRAVVTGRYGPSFSGTSSGAATDPVMGILSYQRLEWLEPPAVALTVDDL